MKKSVLISIIVFVVVVIAVVLIAVFWDRGDKTTTTTEGYTAEQVAEHNTAEDCWYIIEDKVYDITDYLSEDLHPVGNAMMTPLCGKDATVAFNTKNKVDPREHSENAWALLEGYYIGEAAK